MNKNKLNLDSFLSFLDIIDSEEYESGYVSVLLRLPNQDRPQLEINKPSSIGLKSQYYSQAYNPDLTLKANNDVRIIGYSFELNFQNIGNEYTTVLDGINEYI